MKKHPPYLLLGTGLIAALLISSCNPKRTIMTIAVGDMESYFGPEEYDGTELVKLTDHVYTYRVLL